MCGIGGAVGETGADFEVLESHLRHRGRDGRGQFHDGRGDARVDLVHARLAIQDLSEAGAQPMQSASGRFVIAFNGEIYNFHELARQLGAAWRGHSDTEVLLEGWELEGPGFLHRCRGMFAFALWDRTERTLWLVRDRLGVKPLYYVRRGNGLAFASEVRALVASGAVEPELDPDAVASFLTFGAVRGPRTIVRDVRLLEPGTLLRWRAGRGVESRRYWSLPTETAGAPPSRPEAVARVRERLEESMRLRLVSDVPVAVLLSSGIDSSVIAALAARQRTEPVDAFTVRLDEEDGALDEASEAARFAGSLGLRQHDVVLRSSDIVGGIDRAFDSMDQPTIDGINTFFVTEAIHRHGVKVALSGLGGDEVFLGYPSAHGLRRTLALSRLLRPAGRVLAPAVHAAGPALFTKLPLRAAKLLELPDLPATPEAVVALARTLFPAAGRETLGIRTMRRLPATDIRARGDVFARWSRAELTGYMANMLLRDTDAFSMAHPVEVRVPLIDHRLVDYVLSLPGSMRFVPGRQKSLLVDAVGDLLPADLHTRPKRGFVLPTARWLLGPLRAEMDAIVADGSCWRALGMEPRGVASVWRAFTARPSQATASRPWGLLALAKYVERLRGFARAHP